MNFLSSLFFFSCLCLVYSWNLENLGIDINYFVSSIAVLKTKAFLSLPRSVPCNNKTTPTVVEVNWIETSIFSTPNLLTGKYRLPVLQTWGKCEHIQDAISIDLEPRRLTLWILDKGNDKCPPKIVSYSVLYNDIVDTVILKKVPRRNLNCLEVVQKSVDHESRAYIGNAGENTIIVVSLKDLRWRRLKLIDMDHVGVSIRADYLAASKTNPLLFITGKSDTRLFSIDLDMIADNFEKTEKGTTTMVNVTLLGEKLGISRSLESDYNAGLSYFMTRDYAVVRWTIGSSLAAENHNVLGQSYEKLSYVSELFTGPHYGLWALVNPLNEEQCFKKKSLNQTDIPKLRDRVVQILRYNMLLKNMEILEL